MAGSFRWTQDTITPALKAAPMLAHGYLSQLTDSYAARSEAHMKRGAPWQDQTGNARTGLTATSQSSVGEYRIDLYHKVSYGIWLEVRWAGRYAIIVPTIDVMAPQFRRDAQGVMRAMFG